MEKELAQFKLNDGTAFLVEVDKLQAIRGSSIERVAAVNSEQMVLQATQTLEQAIDLVRPVASTVLSRLQAGLTTPADEVEVSFGLKLSAQAGVVFGSVGGDVTFGVKLKWTPDRNKQQGSAEQENEQETGSADGV
ncbi:MAG: CU044_2847 family protein [Cyanobacteria bacterium P01_E01_bin.6]